MNAGPSGRTILIPMRLPWVKKFIIIIIINTWLNLLWPNTVSKWRWNTQQIKHTTYKTNKAITSMSWYHNLTLLQCWPLELLPVQAACRRPEHPEYPTHHHTPSHRHRRPWPLHDLPEGWSLPPAGSHRSSQACSHCRYRHRWFLMKT